MCVKTYSVHRGLRNYSQATACYYCRDANHNKMKYKYSLYPQKWNGSGHNVQFCKNDYENNALRLRHMYETEFAVNAFKELYMMHDDATWKVSFLSLCEQQCITLMVYVLFS